MAELPVPFDPTAQHIWELLNAGKRDEAKKLIDLEVASGRAGDETKRYQKQFFAAGRGRQATGPYRYLDIGGENYWLDCQGVPYADRLALLVNKYGRGVKHIEKCIALYNKALLER